jgi:hypothetical protein
MLTLERRIQRTTVGAGVPSATSTAEGVDRGSRGSTTRGERRRGTSARKSGFFLLRSGKDFCIYIEKAWGRRIVDG